MNQYAKKLKSPVDIQLEVTNKCNEKCRHCYNSWQICEKTKEEILSTMQIDYIIKQIISGEVFSVTITGGEPILNIKSTLHAILKLREAGILTTLNSNLTLVNKNIAIALEKVGLRSILTSIISSNKNTHEYVTQNKGSYEKLLKGINAIKENTNIELSVSMVLTKYNKDDVYKTGKLLKDFGIKNFNVTRGSAPLYVKDYQNIAISKKESIQGLKDLLRAKNDFGIEIINILECYPLCFLSEDPEFYQFSNHICAAGISTLTIGSNGGVRACTHSDKEYGNIFQEDLKTIWDKMDDRRNGEYIPIKCKKCEHLNNCTGGCRIDAQATTGNICDLDPYANPENQLDQFIYYLYNHSIVIQII